MTNPGIISILSSLLFMGCSSQPTYEVTIEDSNGPDLAVVANVESELSQDVCLKDIAIMRREYKFATRDGTEDRNLIDIRVQEAGTDGLPAGIFIQGQSELYSFDSRDYFAAFATYSLSSNELDLWACGSNAAGSRSIRHDPKF